ncbi:hypothetical protein [Streptococcus mitis]|uniref:hypothetical protein n=1 Tax=Streptococcus mitis TaxID=28037 RepID=UPI0021AD8004|nr:hypothetical protein [Streptococcus mitis]
MKSKRWGIFIVVVGLLALVAISVVKNEHCKNGERCRGVQGFSKSSLSPFYAQMISQAVY